MWSFVVVFLSCPVLCGVVLVACLCVCDLFLFTQTHPTVPARVQVVIAVLPKYTIEKWYCIRVGLAGGAGH